jgi:hypothetical protein
MKRWCRNILFILIAVLNYKSLLPLIIPLLDYGSSFILNEDLDLVIYLSLDIDTKLLANVETTSSRDSSIDLEREWDRERAAILGSKADVILKRIAYY